MTRYGMAIDLKRCIGCYTCMLACKAEHGTPPGVFLTRVEVQEFGKYPNVKRIFLPMLCCHCKDAPCVKVCPVEAMTRRDDGIVLVDPEKCVGCKVCMSVCPYDAIFYISKLRGYFNNKLTPFEKLKYAKLRENTVMKCNFCVDRVDKGMKPACVTVCPTTARIFGDLDDPLSELSQKIAARRGYRLREEAQTDPSVYYLPP